MKIAEPGASRLAGIRYSQGESRMAKLGSDKRPAVVRVQTMPKGEENHQTGPFQDPKANGEETTGGEAAKNQADAAQPYAGAGTEGRGVVETCAGRALPILRRTGQLGESGAVPGEDSPSLGPGLTPALTKGESLCHPAGSSFHALVASSQGGASLPGAALCRLPTEVRAVCGNSARTDPCGGGE